ncbi:MAG: glycosyltransferase family 4 protein [Spirochaetes bacterium]|nr:glycosyltransferase family 4 protein [Spirochaetota bacterium]
MGKEVKRILIVNYEYPPLGGGGGVATYDLAVEWAKKCQVDVLTSSFAGLPAFEKSDNINIYRVRILFRKSRDAATFISMASFVFFGFFKGISIIRKNRYDVMNTHFAVPTGPLGNILSKMFKIPNVLSLHGGDIYDPSKKLSPHKSPFFRKVVNNILRKADAIVAQSQNTRDNAVKYYDVNKEVKIIPLAYHPPVMPKADRKKLDIKENDYIITTVGRVIKRKAIDVAINAIARIKDKKVKLYVMGDGPEKENLQNLAADLGVQDRVIFLGFVDDEKKYRYLKASDVFIMTSLHEGFGIVFMEAMYAGLPVISTNHGGQTDFLFHEKNALLIDVGDVDACRKSIERIRKNPDLAARFSANNKKAVKNFYAENVALQYLEIFNSLSGV